MSNLDDPLQQYSGLSLFPRTFPSLPDDLLSSHDYLKSLPVKNPEKLVEQAASILSDGSNLQSVDPNAPSKENGEAVGGNPMENRRQRGPGLGRKRPRFSLLPIFSQPSVSLERTLDMDKLKDPEEFFRAFERLENAKEEIAKQTGIQIDEPVARRPRGPGIPGRVRPKYKHLYAKMQRQESSEAELVNPSPDGPQPEVADEIGTSEAQHKPDGVSSDEAEPAVGGTAAEAEGRGNKDVDDLSELLSHEGLDVDGAVRMLEEKLQIKPLNIGKLNLPEVPRIVLKPLRERKSDKPRQSLSDIHNILRETDRKTPMIPKTAATFVSSFGSPIPPKSPFTVVSLLQKLSSQSNPLSDPFAVPDIDSLSESNACHKRDFGKVGASKEVNPLIIDEEDDTVAGSKSPVAVDFTVLPDGSTEGDKTTRSSGEEDRPSEFCSEVEGKNDDANEEEGNEKLDQSGAAKQLKDMFVNVLQEPVHCTQPYLSVEETIPAGCSNQNEGDPCSPKIPEHCEMESSAPEEHQVNPPDKANEDVTQEPSAVSEKEPSKRNKRKRNGYRSKLMKKKKQRLPATKPRIVDEHIDSNDAPQLISPESEKETLQESPVAPVDQQTKPKRRLVKGKEGREAFSKRKSLTGAGSSYKADGVRRSTRIRSRPLEYWKGERFLYGRIHESLATVIGIKYESTPGKDAARPTGLKVKSYVSDEYKHLVDLAAIGFD
ncbi:Centromere protein C [Linum grandiflorum]